MKKFICTVLAFLMISQFAISAFAEESVDVYSDKISLTTEEQTLVPIYIRNNPGIMGFKITVEYPIDKIDIKSVTRGEVTSRGNFNTNFGMTDGTFDIVWNNVSQIKTDGSLFILSAVANKEISKNTQINLSFSQPDTFNEKYNDVRLNCIDIIITPTSNSTAVSTTEDDKTLKDNVTTKDTVTIDNSQIIDSINITLEKNGYKNLNDVIDKEQFVKDFNSNISKITGSDKYNVSDFETIRSMYLSAYEGQFVAEVTNNIDAQNINKIIKKELDKYNVSSFNKLNDNEKSTVIKNIETQFKKIDTDTPNISKDLKTEDAVKIIKKVYNSSDEKDETNKNNKKYIVFIAVLGAVIILAVIICFVKKRKNKHFD